MRISDSKIDSFVVDVLLSVFNSNSFVYSELKDAVCSSVSKKLDFVTVYDQVKEREKTDRVIDRAVSRTKGVLMRALKEHKSALNKKKWP